MLRPTADIYFICKAHPRGAPTVTLHADHWAYCRGGYADDHDGHIWTSIAPANVSEVERQQIGLIRESTPST